MRDADRIKYIQRDFCKKCEDTTGRKTSDACFRCLFHKLANLAYELALRCGS